MSKLEKLVEDLSTLTVLEASELSKLLEEKWGVSAAAPVAVAAAGGAAAAPAEAVEEQTEFTVVGGLMGEQVLDQASIKALASLPSLDQLRAQLIGLLQAPATKIAGVLQAPGAQVARVIGAYAAKDAA